LKTLVNGIYFLGFVASYNGIYLLGDMIRFKSEKRYHDKQRVPLHPAPNPYFIGPALDAAVCVNPRT
jgi:hypothetical protein